LPRIVGIHPEMKEPIEAGIGRFGPYVKMASVFASLDKDDDVLSVGLNRAVDVLAKKLASVRAMGAHPKDNEPVTVRKGRFGPYVQHGQTVANLPRDMSMDDITLAEAVALLAEKGKTLKAKPGGKKKAAPKAKAKAAPKAEPVAKVATTKAAAPKKAAAKKPAAKKKKPPAKKPAAKKAAG
jgi:DNA topoisomerase-1